MIDTALLLAAPLVVGVVAGWLLGGRLSTLARVRFRALWLLWAAAAVQVIQLFAKPVTEFVEDRLHVPTLAAVFGCVATWLILNMRGQRLAIQLAVAVIFMGGALNALTIAVNEGRMPYESAAAVRAGLPAALETRKNAPADSATMFSDLGDVIAIPLIHKVVSLGDLMIGAGVVAMIVAMMRSAGRLAGATSDAQVVLAHGAASFTQDRRG